ncbi:LLM class flavin-dependent oxidoreductase [Nocardia sp. NPDC050799]|uniref:LLM class flavin-dependent oxidoreductase n=1 Tax=Nocardia sp. NPDC050799 TaxID=3154842 RepID=UPI0033D74DF0
MSFTFGIFDSFDQGVQAPGEVLDERLRFAVEAEKLGIDHYHVTEHHGTALSVCPSPNIFLAALSQRTTRMRIGALVYVLPAYHILRLTEEIATLDHLSGGRLEVGVGSGISPYESAYFGVQSEQMRPVYEESLQVMLRALESGRVQHEGTLLQDYDVQLSIGPLQCPYPPIWYASSNTRSAIWAAQENVNFVGRWNAGEFVPAAEEYWRVWQELRGEVDPVQGSTLDLPRVGVSSVLFIGESDEEALDRYNAAYGLFGERVTKLWHDHSDYRVDGIASPARGLELGNAIVGTVDSVRDQLLAQIEHSPVNYLEVMPYFGDMSYDEARRNLQWFSDHVMPALRASKDAPLEEVAAC